MRGINSIYHDLGYVHTIADSLSFQQEKPQNLSQNWYKSSTHIEHCAGAVAREGLDLEIPILTPEYLTSAAVVSVLFAYSFTFISARILVHIAPKCGTERIRYMPRSTLEIFTAQLLYVSEIARTSPEALAIRCYFRAGAKSIRCSANLTLSLSHQW